MLGAYWEDSESKWRLDLESVTSGERYNERFDYLITAIGHFNEWKLPNYTGFEKFKGDVMHSSGWNPRFDHTGKRVATIGNGASGIQVKTELRKKAAHVDVSRSMF